jgi:hypothetical protein
MMRERDDVRIDGRERRIACRAGGGLEAGAAGTRDVHTMHREGHVAGGALAFAEGRPGIGLLRQAVMDMRGGECAGKTRRETPEGVEEHHRVAPARQRDRDAHGACTVAHRIARSERFAHGVQHGLKAGRG